MSAYCASSAARVMSAMVPQARGSPARLAGPVLLARADGAQASNTGAGAGTSLVASGTGGRRLALARGGRLGCDLGLLPRPKE